MVRMLIVGYCYGIRFERRPCEEVELHLAYRWFCRLDLDDRVPDHSTFSVNRHGRFRDSDVFREIFEGVVDVEATPARTYDEGPRGLYLVRRATGHEDGGVARLEPAGGDDRAPALSAALHGWRRYQPARRACSLSRQ